MADKNLELALRIKADLQQAIRQVNQLDAALDDTRTSADGAGRSGRTAAGGIGAAGAAAGTAAKNTAQAATTTRQYDSALSSANRSSRQLTETTEAVGGGMTALARSVKAVTLTLAAGFGLAQITQSADAWTAYENRLRLVTATQGELAQSSADVYAIARNASQQLDSTAAIYQRFAQNADRLNISQRETAQLTDTVSKSIAISGGAAASAEAATVQFGQALASGVFRGEEFNSVMEQAPGLALALAEGLSVDIGKLREMANEGQLTADVLVEALGNAAASVDEQFETRVRTISQAATEFDAAFTRIIGTLSSGTGAGEGIADAISALADVLDTLSDNADVVGAALEVALILTAGRAVAALSDLSEETLKGIMQKRADATASANQAKAQEGVAIAAQRAAAADLEKAKAAVTSAQAELRATGETAKRTAAQASAAKGLSTHTVLEARATQAANAHAAAQARLDAALEARTVATGNAAAATATLTQATNASTVAAERARVANSLLLTSLARLKTAGAALSAALGGPVGIAVSVGLVAASFIDFGDDAERITDSVTQSLRDMNVPLSEAVDKLKELTQLEQDRELKQLSDDISQQQNERVNDARQLANLATPGGERAGGWLGASGPQIQAARWSAETQQLMNDIREASARAAQGLEVNFDQIGTALSESSEISDDTKERMLDLMDSILKGGRKAENLTERLNSLKAALEGTETAASSASGSINSPKAVTDAQKYLTALQKQNVALQNLTPIEEALLYMRENQIDRQSELGKMILAQVEANQKLAKSNEDAAESERKKKAAEEEADRTAEQRRDAQRAFVEQLERTVALQNKSAEEVRQYRIAEQGLTGQLLARARAASQAIAAQERLNQVTEDARQLQRIQSEVMALSGDAVGARSMELEQEFGELLSRLESRGDDAGTALVNRLINLDLARTRLSEVQSEIDSIINKQNLAEESVNIQQDAGLISELEARDRILQIHRQTYEVLQQQRPLLEELSKQPGVIGEQASAMLGDLDNQANRLQNTTTLLGSTLKDGLEAGIAGSIRGLADGTMTLRDATVSLIQSVGDAMIDMLAKIAAQKAVAGLAGMFPGLGFSTGGLVVGPGTGTSDSIPARLSNKEFVTRAAVVEQPGALPFLSDFNQRGMAALDDWTARIKHATGGLAGVPAPQMSAPQLNQPSLTQPQQQGGEGQGMSLQANFFMDPEEMAQKMASTASWTRQFKATVKAEKSSINAILGS
ncbi:tape measure protein [Marinobacterium litorale]|uniref:tape measure protein n=1 Tax=Marinobacterium litorale TaxID=404770 RepID=UPI000429AB26|nr:tape measure protein [Marinobacterium litorale]